MTFEGKNLDGIPSLYQLSGIRCAKPCSGGNWVVCVRESDEVFEINIADGDFFRLQVRFVELYGHTIPLEPVHDPLVEWLTKAACY